jgi:lipopolysaccharide export system permease protein
VRTLGAPGETRLEFERAVGGIYRRYTIVQPCELLEVPRSITDPFAAIAASVPRVRIINRYILREHVGPFVFSLSALTSLLLLQYIARRFGDLVGRGLTWQVITEFMLLSIPFTLALTVPMSVLVSVLYAFSRLAAENEITALKAGGVSTRSLMRPVVVAGSALALFMLYFNDQLMPRANHELATLQNAILHTKPTFAIRPQILNTIKEGNLYLRAGAIDEGSGLMKDVTIYDLGDPNRRRTIYADSGTLTFAANRQDLNMLLTNGVMMSTPSDQPGQLNRIYYHHETLKVRDVANQFMSFNADTASKGDREMSICEMQIKYDVATMGVRRARYDSLLAVWRINDTGRVRKTAMPEAPKPGKAGGIGAVYCTLVDKYLTKAFRVQQAQAAELPVRLRTQQQDTVKRTRDTTKKAQDTTKKTQDTTKRQADTSKRAQDSATKRVLDSTTKRALDSAAAKAVMPPANAGAANPSPVPPVNAAPANAIPANAQPPLPNAAAPVPNAAGAPPTPTPPTPSTFKTATPEHVNPNPELQDAGLRIGEARQRAARFGIEIQKKFSLAAACIVFVLVGAPLAVRFPRGGVGLVIGASFFVFAVYYIALTSGESLANRNFITPFWAMWADNIIFLIVAIPLIMRMGTERVTSRGGGFAEKVDGVRLWFARMGATRRSRHTKEGAR